MAYLRGGFCEECYQDETKERVRQIDQGYSSLADQAQGRLHDILSLPLADGEGRLLKSVLNPLLKAITLIERRFKRPEQINVAHRIQKVSVVGSPVDFAEAAKVKAQAALDKIPGGT